MSTRILDKLTDKFGKRPPHKSDQELLAALRKDGLPSLARLLSP